MKGCVEFLGSQLEKLTYPPNKHFVVVIFNSEVMFSETKDQCFAVYHWSGQTVGSCNHGVSIQDAAATYERRAAVEFLDRNGHDPRPVAGNSLRAVHDPAVSLYEGTATV